MTKPDGISPAIYALTRKVTAHAVTSYQAARTSRLLHRPDAVSPTTPNSTEQQPAGTRQLLVRTPGAASASSSPPRWPDGPAFRHPAAGRGRVHPRHPQPRRQLAGHQPRCPCLARAVLPGLWLAGVRTDPAGGWPGRSRRRTRPDRTGAARTEVKSKPKGAVSPRTGGTCDGAGAAAAPPCPRTTSARAAPQLAAARSAGAPPRRWPWSSPGTAAGPQAAAALAAAGRPAEAAVTPPGPSSATSRSTSAALG